MGQRILVASLLLLLMGLDASVASAQPEESSGTDASSDEASDEASDEELDLLDDDEAWGDEEEEPRLRAPAVSDTELALDIEEEEELEAEVAEGEAPSPDESADLMRQAEPPSSDPTRGSWTSPQSVVSLHGYFRLRGNMTSNLHLDRPRGTSTAPYLPFNAFIPALNGLTPDGGCGGSATTGAAAESCGGEDKLRWADMRLRLQPTIALSDDIRVHMMFDVLDNVVLGSTPDGELYLPPGAPTGDPDAFTRQGRNPTDTTELLSQGVPLSFYNGTQLSGQALGNYSRDYIVVRRAYAEVTNRGLGQLRFGRMGDEWGMGMQWNAGEDIDGDFSTEVDRIMGITKIAGIYVYGTWDFPGEGLIYNSSNSLRSVPFDATNEDDIRQWTFGVVYRMEQEEQANRLAAGNWVLNGGLRFQYRKQFLDYVSFNAFSSQVTDGGVFARRDARAYIPNLWGQFLWKNMRLEVEAAGVFGGMDNASNVGYDPSTEYDIREFGIAFESEFRLLEDSLGLYFNAGFASGDRDVDGLSDRENLVVQQSTDNTISAFSFHPNYRVDLILWRTIMGRVSSAWYLRPSVSYDIIQNDFGQRLGAKLDIIYSQAANSVQTYGGEMPLGLELDTTLYYRSEDGPDALDGFYGAIQFGILFPFDGLGFRPGEVSGGNPSVGNAWMLRMLMAVQF